MRRLFEREVLPWISSEPFTEDFWNPCMQTLEGHSDTVSSVAFSSDGRFVVSGSYDRNVKIWDTRGHEIHTLKGHADKVNSVACSGDSRLIASGSDDKTVKIWDAATGREIQTLLSHPGVVRSVAFSGDGRYIVSGSKDNTVRIWNPFTGQKIQKLSVPGVLFTVAFSGDGRFVVSKSADSVRKINIKIHVWDAATGQMIWEVSHIETRDYSVALSSNCRLVVWGPKPVSSLEDLTSLLEHRPTFHLQTTPRHGPTLSIWHGDEWLRGEMQSVDFSSNGRYVVSGFTGEPVKIWDAVTGLHLQTLISQINCVQSAAISKDGNFVVTGCSNNLVKMWMVSPAREAEVPKSHEDEITSMIFSRDGMLVASVGFSIEAHSRNYRGSITIWDALTGRKIRKITDHTEDGPQLAPLTFSSDGRLVAARLCDLQNSITIWDVDTGCVFQTFPGNVEDWDAVTGHTVRGVIHHHFNPNYGDRHAIAFSGDDRFLASAIDGVGVNIWEIATGHRIRRFRNCCRASSVVLSSDGGLMMLVSRNQRVRIWNVATGDKINTLDVGTMLRAFPSNLGPLYQTIGDEHEPVGRDDTPTSVATEFESRVEYRLQVRELTKGYGVTSDCTWITWNGSPVLWLPQEYRPRTWAASSLGIAIRTATRRLIILRFTGPPKSN